MTPEIVLGRCDAAHASGRSPSISPAWPSRSNGWSRCSNLVASPSSRTRRTRFRAGSEGPAVAMRARSDGPAPSPSMPRRRSRLARAACSSPTTTRSRTGPAYVAAWHQPRRLEPLRGKRLLVLRDRGRRLQVQHDRYRRGAGSGPARAGERAARGAPVDRGGVYDGSSRPPLPRTCWNSPRTLPDGSHAWHLYIVRLELDRLAHRSGAGLERSRDRGIGASVHFIPLHLHPYYRRRWGSRARRIIPVATQEYERVISLPIWPGMTEDDVTRVVETLASILDRLAADPRVPNPVYDDAGQSLCVFGAIVIPFVNDVPWLLPGLLVVLVVCVAAARPVGRWLGVSPVVAGVMILNLGVFLLPR